MKARDVVASSAEAMREASERTLTAVLRTSPDAICLNRAADGLFVEVNEGFTTLTGLTAEDVGGRTWENLGIWDDPAGRARLVARLRDDGEVRGFEARLRHKDGTVITALVSASVLEIDGEQCILSVTTDVSARARAETRIRMLNRVYAVLSGINQALVHLRERQALFDEACRVIVEDGGFRAAWVGLVDSDGKRVRVVARAGVTEGYLEDIDIVLGDERRGRGPTGVSISERRHVAFQDIEHDPAMAPWRENALRHGYRSSASFPLVVGDATLGALSMYADEPGFFSDEQIALLDELAANISFALEFAEGEDRRRQAEENLERRGARLEELLEERERNLELLSRSLSGIIEVVSRVVELRDPYTAGHQRRVSELAVRISQEMDMSAREIEEIRVAALIHDVGKVSVPAEMLTKPGALSPLELALIKGHAEAGYRIIASANMEGPTAQIIYQHHERCDGSGYPRGLSADQLLLSAKVLMVADVVEAMISHRPYRAGLGLDVALLEIEKGAGSVYDVEICRACATVFRERGFAFSET